MKFRKLRADEIECRVSTVSDKGCSLLLYKDARCDMNLLDEEIGAGNWQRKHELINGNLFCNVGIKIDGEWVWKQDVGVESYTEKEKGQASDSFKRACFNWGIGRELYTAPFIWIGLEGCTLTEKNGKKTTYDTFSVESIGYDEAGNINSLSIRNNKRKQVVYSFGQPVASSNNERIKLMQDIGTEMQRTGITEALILARYNVAIKDMDVETLKKVLVCLKKSKDKA